MPIYNPNKNIKIEIRQSGNVALDYEIWDIGDKDRSKCICRNAQEEDIEYILTPGQYAEFKNGKYVILVNANLLTNCFSYLY